MPTPVQRLNVVIAGGGVGVPEETHAVLRQRAAGGAPVAAGVPAHKAHRLIDEAGTPTIEEIWTCLLYTSPSPRD